MSHADLLSPRFVPNVTAAFLTSLQWEHLLGQSRRALLTARLAHSFSDSGQFAGEVPAGPRRHLEASRITAELWAQIAKAEVLRIERALRSAGMTCVLLKGAAYLCAGLPPSRGRVFSDVDILVPQVELSKAESALLAGGWIPDHLDSEYDQRYYREWMHELPPLSHVQRDSTIDVHYTITPPTSAFNVDGALLLVKARPIEGHPGLWTLQPTDMVLHSAVHLFAEGEFHHGLRDLLDMDDLLKHFAVHEPDFWPELIARANELGLKVPLHHALFHVERLFGTRPPAELAAEVRALRPPWLLRVLMARLLTIALRPMHPSCHVPGEGLARWLLYVRSHWLRMPLHLLVPHLVRKAWMAQFPEKKKPADAETAQV